MVPIVKKRPTLLVLVLALVFIVFGISVSAAADLPTPDIMGFSNMSPANETDVTTNNPTISAHLSNVGGTYDINQVSLVLDGGLPVKPTVSGVEPEYNISYTPTLADGAHTVTISVYDKLNPSTPVAVTWGFNVKVPPVISMGSPTYTVTTGIPSISAYISDNVKVARGDIIIDGKPITSSLQYLQTQNSQFRSTYVSNYARISAQPSTSLTEGQHTVSLVAYDAAGNQTATQWSFSVDTNVGTNYPDMPMVNDTICWKCHASVTPLAAGQYSSRSVAGTHPEVKACYSCHTTSMWTSSGYRNCTNCHFGNTANSWPLYLSFRHTSDGSPAFTNLPNVRHQINDVHLSSTKGCEKCHSRILTDEHYRPDRTDKNGNRINCDTCHTGSYLGDEVNTNGILKLEQNMANPSALTNPWYAPAGRTISRVYVDQILTSSYSTEIYVWYNNTWAFFCQPYGTVAKWYDLPVPVTAVKTQLHPPYWDSLTQYWRTDIPKVLLTPTASNGDYQAIQSAITNKDTSCEACHGNNVDHEAKHVSTLNTNCLGCHDANLSKEHREHPKRTGGRDLTCETCHSSGDKAVKRTIAGNSLNCAGCHNSVHNVNFADKVPANIPLYTGYQWSTPTEAFLYTGDTGIPAGYDSGQVVLSNRRKDVTADDIWKFYGEKLPSNGWTLMSAAPAAGATSFVVDFVYGERAATVKCYNTENRDGSSSEVGYRTEIWYK